MKRHASLTLRMSQDSTIEETSPPWIIEVRNRLEYLRNLPEDWDREGAPRIDFECWMKSLVLLLECAANETPAPQFIPTSEGGLQLEWHVDGIDLELRFSPTEPSTFYHVDRHGIEAEGLIEAEGQQISSILRALPTRNETNNPCKMIPQLMSRYQTS